MLKDLQAHATIPVSDVGRAKLWYEEKLGLTPSSETPGGLMYECGQGTRFALYPSPEFAGKAGQTDAGFAAVDVEAEVAELKARGVTFEEYDTEFIKTVEGIATLGQLRAGWFRDQDGNILGVVQFPPS